MTRTTGALIRNEVYFSVAFVDRLQLVPVVRTLVFLGTNLEAADAQQVYYFQSVESYQSGIRYSEHGASHDGEFCRIAENRLDTILSYEEAIDVLLGCLDRRRASATEIRNTSSGSRPGKDRDLSKELESLSFCGAPMDATLRAAVLKELEREPLAFRFEDEDLQSALIADLNRMGVRYQLNDDRTVIYSSHEWLDVGDAINRVRDAQFRWYLLNADTDEYVATCRAALRAAQLPFFVEYQRGKAAFLVRRDDRERHEAILGNSRKHRM